ncbi:MAG TPA: hypothetical protein VHU84_17665, partial [Lacipirellulaceae bacterium]|nr:hypothetical protein [Lacipirellulaceae bacterium]
STFGKPDLSTIDGFAVQEARIDPKAIHHIVRSKYRDERWSGVSWVFLFFFFDENDHLIGHSFYEEGVWL